MNLFMRVRVHIDIKECTYIHAYIQLYMGMQFTILMDLFHHYPFPILLGPT